MKKLKETATMLENQIARDEYTICNESAVKRVEIAKRRKELLSIALEAVNKQIPKPMTPYKIEVEDDWAMAHICPTCGKVLRSDSMVLKVCSCGQMLKRGEE